MAPKDIYRCFDSNAKRSETTWFGRIKLVKRFNVWYLIDQMTSKKNGYCNFIVECTNKPSWSLCEVITWIEVGGSKARTKKILQQQQQHQQQQQQQRICLQM